MILVAIDSGENIQNNRFDNSLVERAHGLTALCKIVSAGKKQQLCGTGETSTIRAFNCSLKASIEQRGEQHFQPHVAQHVRV